MLDHHRQLILVAVREATYHRGERAITVRPGEHVIVAGGDPTVCRGELFDLVREGLLRPLTARVHRVW
jgi:hypothetical protein